MRHRILALIFAVLAAACCVGGAGAATPAEVEKALQKAKKFLYEQQNKDGHWETGDRMAMHGSGRAWGGHTAIATYALLVAGESPQDPRLQKALEFLYKEDIELVYALGLRGQIWNLLPPGKNVLAAAKRDKDFLLNAVNTRLDEPGAGLYHYGLKNAPGAGNYHNSTAQYGVLGMWGAQLAGAEVPNDYWKLVDLAWKKNQDKSGGWAYNAKVDENNKPSASMTTAGVATLFITQDYLYSNEGIKCTGNVTNPHIEAGMKWIADHYGSVNGNLYTMYGVERIGVASGYKYFGSTDWYASGAEWLVRNQGSGGHWNDHGYVPGTSFGIVFLTRGRAPVMFNKLDYSDPPPATQPSKEKEKGKSSSSSRKEKPVERRWNQRPRDAANVVHWLGETLERPLNWQIVNLRIKNADELHDAPILYISGDEPLDFDKDEVATLKRFVEQGGLILGNADCGKSTFATSFAKLGEQMFPRFEFRVLPFDHPIYTRQLFPMKEKRAPLTGMTNGSRELMLLIPRDDPARAWQTRSEHTKKEAYQLAANIFLYAVDKKNLRYKGETYLVADKGMAPSKTLKIARLAVGKNHDPEPAGWRRLANMLKNDDKVAVEVTEVKPGEGKLTGGKVKVAHLTGTGDFKLDGRAREALAGFVKAGGTLIVDAAGGNTPFADAAERELGTTFAEISKTGLAIVPAKHELYTNKLTEVKNVAYRAFTRDVLRGVTTPRVKAIDVGGGRLGVFFSREDLSTGLVGQPVDGIYGYEPATAARIMRAMLLYALNDGKLPTTQPATKSAK